MIFKKPRIGHARMRLPICTFAAFPLNDLPATTTRTFERLKSLTNVRVHVPQAILAMLT